MTKGVAHWVKSSATDFTTKTIGVQSVMCEDAAKVVLLYNAVYFYESWSII